MTTARLAKRERRMMQADADALQMLDEAILSLRAAAAFAIMAERPIGAEKLECALDDLRDVRSAEWPGKP